jgi:putative DNA primase/helicase
MTSPPTGKTLDAFGPFPYWVVWRRETRINADGTKYETKITYDPRSGKLAAVDNPQTWATCDEARLFSVTHKYDGIGLVLGEHDEICFGGIDLDRCRNLETGVIADWALEIVEYFNSYTELSPSRTGLKIFFYFYPNSMAEVLDELFMG